MNKSKDLKAVEFVEKFLLAQRERAADGLGMCKYRAPSGLKCAVGCLIPDELYTKNIEGACLNQPNGPEYDELVKVLAQCELTNLNLLEKLQFIHDELAVGKWRGAFEALKENLKENAADFIWRVTGNEN